MTSAPQTTLKNGNPNSNNEAITPGWFLPVRLPDGNGGYTSGAADYRAEIANCNGHPVVIGQYLPTETGNMVGPTAQGVGDLVNKDSGASWDAVNKRITGTCAPSCAPISPRIVPITVFDMDEFQWRRESGDWTSAWQTYPANPCPTGGRCVRVTNILGFFVDHMSGNDVVGYLMSLPGEFVMGAPSVGGGAGVSHDHSVSAVSGDPMINVSVLVGSDKQLPDMVRACGARAAIIDVADLKILAVGSGAATRRARR